MNILCTEMTAVLTQDKIALARQAQRRIVCALRDYGLVAGFLGDGINDFGPLASDFKVQAPRWMTMAGWWASSLAAACSPP
jgi:hypothetical protein